MNTYNQLRNLWGNPYQFSSMYPRTGSLMEVVSPSPTRLASRPPRPASPQASCYTKVRRSLTVLVITSSGSGHCLCHWAVTTWLQRRWRLSFSSEWLPCCIPLFVYSMRINEAPACARPHARLAPGRMTKLWKAQLLCRDRGMTKMKMNKSFLCKQVGT